MHVVLTHMSMGRVQITDRTGRGVRALRDVKKKPDGRISSFFSSIDMCMDTHTSKHACTLQLVAQLPQLKHLLRDSINCFSTS